MWVGHPDGQKRGTLARIVIFVFSNLAGIGAGIDRISTRHLGISHSRRGIWRERIGMWLGAKNSCHRMHG